jgi:hypothetical protein
MGLRLRWAGNVVSSYLLKFHNREVLVGMGTQVPVVYPLVWEVWYGGVLVCTCGHIPGVGKHRISSVLGSAHWSGVVGSRFAQVWRLPLTASFRF